MEIPAKSALLVAGLLGWASFLAGADNPSADLMKGKVKTGREIVVDFTVNAPLNQVSQLWTTSAGAKQFFGLDAHVDPRVGGEYTMIFDPEHDPEGRMLGTKGARILRYEPNQFLAFEWKGTPEMPEMNVVPLPTWVEVSFQPLGEKGEKTHLRIAHYGFGTGQGWDKAYAFFSGSRGWIWVLNRLTKVFPDFIQCRACGILPAC